MRWQMHWGADRQQSTACPRQGQDQVNFSSIYKVAAIMLTFFSTYQNFSTQTAFIEQFFKLLLNTHRAGQFLGVCYTVFPSISQPESCSDKLKPFILSVVSPHVQEHQSFFHRSYVIQTLDLLFSTKICTTQETKIYLKIQVLTQA